MASKFKNITGIVLGTRDIKDYDKMLIILSPELGKLHLMVYGANRFKSRFSNKINNANIIKGFIRYPNSLDKLPSIEDIEILVDFFGELKKNNFKLMIVNFITEITNLVVPIEVFDEEIYNLIIRALQELTEKDNENDNFNTLTKFCISLLKNQGILPFIKTETLSDRTKRYVIRVMKGNYPDEVGKEIKLEFLEWFSRKISTIIPKKIISIEMLNYFI
ncbi:MAG: DNA repair protein RecO [Brevinematia bacterium]